MQGLQIENLADNTHPVPRVHIICFPLNMVATTYLHLVLTTVEVDSRSSFLLPTW